MPTLTINGQNFSFAPGATILEIAQQNGVSIPHLCHHPQLKPAGMCRMCLVEIEGQRAYQTACTTLAVEGMTVRTNTPALIDLRREILSLILSEHPYTCLVCDRHDRCNEWQVTIRKAAITTGCENCPKNGQCELQKLVDEVGLSLMPYCISYRGLPVAKDDPFFDRDYNLCILCGRCVRVCQEVRHTSTLAFIQRGAQTVVGTAYGQSHLLTGCEFCGACVDICPTGALYDKRTKWEGVPEGTARTVCPYCSVGCELDLWVKQGRAPVVMGVRPAAEGIVNRGQACARGRFGLVDMIHAPDRLRTPLVRKDGRLAEVSWEEALAFLAERLPAYRGEAFAMLLSPHLTTEAAYLLQKFARQGQGSDNVDLSTGLPRLPRAAELAETLLSFPSAPIRSILEARTILVLGANPRLSHPVVGLYIRQAQARGARLIVADPRCTELAERADIWLQVTPGEDAELVRRLSDRRSKIGDQEIFPSPASPSMQSPFVDGVPAPSPQLGLPFGGGQEGGWEEAARLLAENGPAVIIFGSGITHYPSAPDTLRAIGALAGALEPPAGMLPLLGAANLRGTLQAGAAALSTERDYTRIVQRIAAGTVKALYLAGELPPLEALENLELLVVQDSFLSPLAAQYAHVILPAASFAEISGTYTNLEGRPAHFDAAIPPLGESRPDGWIVSQLAQAMGLEEFQLASAEEIAGDGWQVAGDSPSAIPNPQSATFTLLVERNQFSYRGSALTARVHGMAQYKADEGALMLNRADAAELGLQDGGTACVTSAYGRDTLRVQIDPGLPAKTAFTSINAVHGSVLFPAKLPEVKAYAVNISAVALQDR